MSFAAIPIGLVVVVAGLVWSSGSTLRQPVADSASRTVPHPEPDRRRPSRMLEGMHAENPRSTPTRGATSTVPGMPSFEALVDLDRDAGISAIVTALRSTDAATRLRAVEAMAHRDDGIAALGPLAIALADHDRDVRRAALEAVAWHDGPEAIRLVARIVHDPDPELRLAAVDALGERGDEALWAVRPALFDSDEDVRARARHFLGLAPQDD